MVWNCEACKHPNIRESMQQCYKCHSVRQPTRGVDAAAKRKSNDSKDAIKAPPTKKPFRGSSSASPKNVASFGSAKRGLKGSSQVKIAPKANTASGSSGTAEKSCLSSFILKNPSAPSTQSTVASTRAKKPSLMPRKEKDMTQMSIKDMFFKPKSTDTTSEATKKAQRKKFLQQESPDPAATSTLQRVTEIQFLRDRLSIVPPSNVQPIKELPLNDEQLRAAIAPPDVPLSIRAGAGSGKTHTMVQRARYLVTNYQFDPEEILMITFSNRAANELKERIAAMFTSMYPSDDYPRLPTVKTFHGLAFNWVRMYWKACGLGRSPTILATESQQRSLMKIAIETHLNNLRLERCKRILWKARDLPEEITWDDVLARFQEKHKENHQEAVLKARKRVDEDVKNQSKSQALKAEIKAARKLYLREECYLSLMKMRGCDLKHKYNGTRLDNLRLEKCKRMLWDVKKWPEETSWDEVLKHIREEHKDIYKRAVFNANKRADKDAKKQPTPKTTEESQQIRELYLREECYIALLRKQDCDLKRRWTGDTDQCRLFLKLITKARMHNHNKNDYPQDDACVWELYEKLQRETGQLDFDVLLSMFTEEALQVENIRGRFHAMYSHVVVDEFQDNSELQAEMLRKIVKGGSLTVVGDDDQCSKSNVLLLITYAEGVI